MISLIDYAPWISKHDFFILCLISVHGFSIRWTNINKVFTSIFHTQCIIFCCRIIYLSLEMCFMYYILLCCFAWILKILLIWCKDRIAALLTTLLHRTFVRWATFPLDNLLVLYLGVIAFFSGLNSSMMIISSDTRTWQSKGLVSKFWLVSVFLLYLSRIELVIQLLLKVLYFQYLVISNLVASVGSYFLSETLHL
jgi:hypothetical protein